jgi:pyruvate formate lyase activating enzyme
MTAGEVVKAVELDRPYFADGGGATLSGGEPMAQADFATELARRLCDCGISVAMETCGFAAPEQFQRIAPYIDLFLFDYKATGSVLHKELTGVEPDVILRNLRLVNDMDKRIILRCPMIPGVNDSDAHLEAIADLANRLANIIEVHILPYHRIGEGKRVQLGEAPSLGGVEPPGAEVRRAWIETLRKLGCDAKLI